MSFFCFFLVKRPRLRKKGKMVRARFFFFFFFLFLWRLDAVRVFSLLSPLNIAMFFLFLTDPEQFPSVLLSADDSQKTKKTQGEQKREIKKVDGLHSFFVPFFSFHRCPFFFSSSSFSDTRFSSQRTLTEANQALLPCAPGPGLTAWTGVRGAQQPWLVFSFFFLQEERTEKCSGVLTTSSLFFSLFFCSLFLSSRDTSLFFPFLSCFAYLQKNP